MVGIEVRIVGEAEGTERRGDGALPGSEERAHEEALGMGKDGGREEWREGEQECYHVGRQEEHGGVLSCESDGYHSFSCCCVGTCHGPRGRRAGTRRTSPDG